MSTRLQDLAPDVRRAAEAADAELDRLGIANATTSTNRTQGEQVALFCQGGPENGRAPLNIVNLVRQLAGMRPLDAPENRYTVTRADGINTPSNHQGGRALDKVPTERGKDGVLRAVWPPNDDPRWAQIAAVMKRHGFAWGGDWPPGPDGKDRRDCPHYEMISPAPSASAVQNERTGVTGP